MSEEHLDPLSLAARHNVGIGLCDCASLIASGLMNGACDLACGHVRAASGLERARVAVEFAGAVNDRAVLGDIRSQRREQAAAFAKLLPAWANSKRRGRPPRSTS